MRSARILAAVLLALAAGAAVAEAPVGPGETAAPRGVPPRSRALLIVGLGGDKQHHDIFVERSDAIAEGLRDLGYADLVYLAEDAPPRPGVAGRSDAGSIRAEIARLSAGAQTGDRLLVVLVGHASGEGEHWRMNLPGGDLSAGDWKELLAGHPGTVCIVAACPSAEHLLKTLAGPLRIVLASTRADEVRTWAFLEALAETVRPRGLPPRGAPSRGAPSREEPPRTAWDLFDRLEKGVVRAFIAKGFMRNEHASLEDDGDGRGTELAADAPSEAGSRRGSRTAASREAAFRRKDGASARAFSLRGDATAASPGPNARAEGETRPVEAPADTQVAALAALPDPSGVDAVLLLHEEEGDIDEDLSMRWRMRRVTKVLTEAGRTRGDIEMTFPPGVAAEVSRARTILPDGRIIEADTRAILEGLLLGEEEAPGVPASGSVLPRALRLHLSEAVPGAVLDVEIRISMRNFDIQGDFFRDIYVQEDIPVRRARVVVRHPRRLALRMIPTGLPGAATTADEGRYGRLLRYEAENLEAVVTEPFADPAPLRAGRLVLTSIGSWDEVARWYHLLSRPAIRADTEVRSLALRLTKDLPSDEEKLKVLYEWVSEEIRYVAIPLGVHGYKPHAVPNVLRRRFGDCKDKASLLIALLREAGLRGHIVLIGAGLGDVVADAPRPSAFNHAIVAVPRTGGGVLFLDPTAENAGFGTLPPADQGRHALVVWGETGTLLATPYDPAESNALRIDRFIRVEGEDLVVEETRISTGRWALERRTLIRHAGLGEAKKILAENLVRRWENASLEAYEAEASDSIHVPLRERLKYRLASGARAGLVPWEPSPLAGLTADRRAPVSLGTTFLLEETTTAPASLVPPQDRRIANDLGEFEITTAPTQGGWIARRRFSLRVPTVERSRIADLLENSSLQPSHETRESFPDSIHFSVWMIGFGVVLLGILLGFGIGRIVRR